MIKVNDKVNVFISYSHVDREHCKELKKHLNPLKKAKLIDSWEDGELLPGDNWDEVIKKNLDEADIVLFLLSIDFLNSNYIEKNEIKLAIEKHKKGKLKIVPIMLRKCYIDGTIFSQTQGLPTGLEPIQSKKWDSQDDAYFNVVNGLSKIIKKLIADKEPTIKKNIISDQKKETTQAKTINVRVRNELDVLKKEKPLPKVQLKAKTKAPAIKARKK